MLTSLNAKAFGGKRTLAVLLALAIVAASSALGVSPAGAAVVPLPTEPTFMQRWAPAAMASSGSVQVTHAQAVSIAQTFDVITAHPGAFTAFLPDMRAANPKIIVLQYENSMFAATSTQYPSSWYARNALGGFVRAAGVGIFQPGNYMMDMSNANWLAASAQQCATDRVTSGYDGCYYGMLSLAALSKGYLQSAPINPNTGQVWTSADMAAALQNAATSIRNANPGVAITGNTLGTGLKDLQMRPVLDLLDAGQAEDFLRGGLAPPTTFIPEHAWVKEVNMLVDAGSRGDSVLAQTKVWSNATAQQIDDLHKYTVATFLMGTNGNSYLNFSSASSMAGVTANSPYDNVNVGPALDAYTKVNGLYQRDFQIGIAFANPTLSSASVPLTKCYTGLSGTTYTTSITLQPNQGDVLLQNC